MAYSLPAAAVMNYVSWLRTTQASYPTVPEAGGPVWAAGLVLGVPDFCPSQLLEATCLLWLVASSWHH